MLLALINEAVENTEDSCNALRAEYEEYSYLWKTDMETYFAEFCDDAIVESPLGQKLADLDKFNAAVVKYEEVYTKISKIKSPTDIVWLRINVNPIKATLLDWCKKWSLMFTDYLKSNLR